MSATGRVGARRGRRAALLTAAAVAIMSSLFAAGNSAADLAASAAAPAVTATFTPTSVDPASGRSRNAALILAASVAVKDLDLSFITDPGIAVTPSEVPDHLDAKSSVSVSLAVYRSFGAPASASVEASVTYTRTIAKKAVTESIVAALTVGTPETSPAAASPISITTPSEEALTLIQYQSADLFFQVTNSADREEHITSLVLTYPNYFAVDYLPIVGTSSHGRQGRLVIVGVRTLAPGDSVVLHLHVDASKPVQPGDSLLVLTASAQDSLDHRTTTTTGSQKLSVEVFGESGVLDVLGVPSLLFVPGLVFVAVLWALWRFVWPRAAFTFSTELGLEAKAAMWVFALLPTLLFPFLYPIVTGWFGDRRDYRRTYGLDDILFVWLMAAAAALAVWIVAVLVRFVWARYYVIHEGDPPRDVLVKIARRPWGRSLKLTSAMYRIDDAVTPQEVYVLRRGAERSRVIPPVAVTTNGLSSAKVKKLNKERGHALRLWWFVYRHRDNIALSYATTEPLTGPATVATTALTTWSESLLVQ